jgi:hypothetical protein
VCSPFQWSAGIASGTTKCSSPSPHHAKPEAYVTIDVKLVGGQVYGSGDRTVRPRGSDAEASCIEDHTLVDASPRAMCRDVNGCAYEARS